MVTEKFRKRSLRVVLDLVILELLQYFLPSFLLEQPPSWIRLLLILHLDIRLDLHKHSVVNLDPSFL